MSMQRINVWTTRQLVPLMSKARAVRVERITYYQVQNDLGAHPERVEGPAA